MNIPYLFHIDSLPVRVYDVGRGYTIVLLHGFALNADIWEFVIKELEEDFRLIAIDLPGHGDTASFPGMHDLSEMASWLNRMLVEMEVEKFTLIGHSLGGYIALNYAEKFPEKLEGFGLFHSLAMSDTSARVEIRNKTIRYLEIKGPKEYLHSFYPQLYTSMPAEVLERFLEIITLQPQYDALIAYTEAMRDRKDKSEILKNLEMPVLFVMGSEDAFIPKGIAREEMMMAKNPIPCLMDNVGHLGMLEDPLKAAAAIRQLLEVFKRT